MYWQPWSAAPFICGKFQPRVERITFWLDTKGQKKKTETSLKTDVSQFYLLGSTARCSFFLCSMVAQHYFQQEGPQGIPVHARM